MSIWGERVRVSIWADILSTWGERVYQGVGLLVRAGEIVLVEVLGVEEGGAGVVGEAGRRGNHLLLLLVLPLLPRDLRLLRLHTHKPACTVITLTLPRQQ